MKDFIIGRCKTNLDNYDTTKVVGFAKVPNFGELVSCDYKGMPTTLRVYQIIHSFADGEPYIIVELTK